MTIDRRLREDARVIKPFGEDRARIGKGNADYTDLRDYAVGPESCLASSSGMSLRACSTQDARFAVGVAPDVAPDQARFQVRASEPGFPLYLKSLQSVKSVFHVLVRARTSARPKLFAQALELARGVGHNKGLPTFNK
ncbi:MAG: hypothetical protein ACE15C_16220 [Phycisphaerae bacterium]